jgi:hypothetical protein
MTKKGFKGTLEKQLKVYSAAAAGVLALAPSADAAIHYSGIANLPVNSSTPQNIDLDNDGNNDFSFNPIIYPGVGLIEMRAGTNGFIATSNGNSDAANVASNYLIGPTLAGTRTFWRTVPYSSTLNGTQNGSIGTNGNFNNTAGFIGVRFHATACQGNDWNYGWIQYRGRTIVGSSLSGTIIDWAYEDQCNAAVAAGAGRVAPTSVPTLNQWGTIIFALLLGGLAARILQKQEKKDS